MVTTPAAHTKAPSSLLAFSPALFVPQNAAFPPDVVHLVEVLARIEQRRQLRLLNERLREVS